MEFEFLDDWQKEVLEYDGNILIAKGRRVGATHIMAMKAVEYMKSHESKHPISQIVCASITEDQAKLIIAFALEHAQKYYPSYIGTGIYRPTQTSLTLNVRGNRRVLLARPAGNTESIRGFSAEILMIDEAAFMTAGFWASATPLILTHGGKIWMWSTFDGKEGYFWNKFEDAYINKNPTARFKVWKVPTPETLANRKISQYWTEEVKAAALATLEEERKDMSEAMYGQEYLAEPMDEIARLFDDALIERICILQPYQPTGKTYGGFDIARFGEDQSSFELVEKISDKDIKQFHHEVTSKQFLTQTADKIIELQNRFKCRKLGIDTNGVGSGVYDILLKEKATKNQIVSMNNATVFLDTEEEQKKRLLKEQMYLTLLSLARRGHVQLLKNDEVIASLRSVRYEYVKTQGMEARLRISARYNHPVEGIVRAVQLAVDDKSLKIFATFSKSRKTF